MRVAAVLLVLGACGRLHFDERDASAMLDTAPDALGAFGSPTVVAETSHPLTDDDATATGDALELYWASERLGMAGGFADVFVVRRSSLTGPWSAAAPVAELNSSFEDQSPGVSSDGLTIYLSSRRPSVLSGTSSNIWMATRATRGDAWSAPVFVAELSTTFDEFEAQPAESNLRLVFYRQLASGRDVYESTRMTTSEPWGLGAAIPVVNTTMDELSPCLSSNGLDLLFGSDRGSTPGVHDIYMASRPSVTEPFETPRTVDELNRPEDDSDPWLSSDGRVIFFSSTRSGNPEIYEARR